MTGIRTNSTVKPLRAPRVQEIGATALVGFVSFVLIPAASQIMHAVDVISDRHSRRTAH